MLRVFCANCLNKLSPNDNAAADDDGMRGWHSLF